MFSIRWHVVHGIDLTMCHSIAKITAFGFFIFLDVLMYVRCRVGDAGLGWVRKIMDCVGLGYSKGSILDSRLQKYFTFSVVQKMIASETLRVVHVQADLFAGAVFLQRAFNWNIYAAIFALLVIAALFTIAGMITK